MLRHLFKRKLFAPSPLRPRSVAGYREPIPNNSSVLRVRADGHLLRAVTLGRGSRFDPTIVFLHEGLGSIAQWKQFPDTLARAAGCNALVYERQGHGGSDPLTSKRKPNFMEREAENSLPELLDSLGLGRVFLYGHSDGGTIALLFAARFPTRTLGVVTEAAHVFVEKESLAGVLATVERFEVSDMKNRLSLYHGDNTETMFHGWADTWLSPEFRDWSIPPETLSKIRAPVLAIQGTEDEYGTPEQLRRIEAGVGERARTLLIPNCSHVPHIHSCETVIEAALQFIGDVRPEEEAEKAELEELLPPELEV